MRNIYQSILKEQSGIAMVLVALCMFMIIGFTALVVDVGGLYFEKSRLQKAVDSAVLGGAQVLKVSESAAENTGIELALDNGFTVVVEEVDTGANFIEIHKTVSKELTFARVLGINQTNVSATARAETLQTLIAGDGIIPVAIEQGDYSAGEPYTMHFQAGNPNNSSVSGNFGFLAIDGPGGNDLKEGIINGSTMEVSEDKLEWTKTGLSWGNVKEGFQTRIDQDADIINCQSYETADNTCSRVVTVPIVETFVDSTGKTLVRIIGFAAFWIEDVVPNGNDKAVVGRFIDYVRGGTFGAGENYGIYGVKLVN
ncbi:pilus assembly protein TadG-related protein [Paenisporosarcina sp. TG20]|uniref:pilus assembly protein TadG-related protein n=1 Tax=Paenisporosarcina sp. TG20 TaxID=1211706 RepID=UPI0002E2D77E|nr:Tad domain-containing protein [Paenisporosarcina sp. TG20]